MKQMKKVLVGCLALTLLFSQGLSYANAKGNDMKKSHNKTKVIDKNKNGIPDRWELKYKLGLGKDVAKKDNDKDGLNNLIEYKLNLNPTSNDTDKDKILDGNEDYDIDGLCNEAELELGTKPEDPDSDKDKIKDGSEIQGKDKTKLSNRIRAFKLEIKTSDKKNIKVEYKFYKDRNHIKVHIKVKDKTGTVTKEMVNSLVRDLQASSSLTEEEVVSKIQSLFNLESSFDIEMEIKYFNGKEIEIEKEIEQNNGSEEKIEIENQQDDNQQDDGEHEDGEQNKVQ
jgi:hypothetical protein